MSLRVPPEVTFDELRHALTPRDPPQFPVGANAEALAEQMRVEGCCVLPALIQGAALERIQAAWLRVHDPIRREYAEAAAKGHGVSAGDARGRSFANSEELPPFSPGWAREEGTRGGRSGTGQRGRPVCSRARAAA